jgi:hypothetical protein
VRPFPSYIVPNETGALPYEDFSFDSVLLTIIKKLYVQAVQTFITTFPLSQIPCIPYIALHSQKNVIGTDTRRRWHPQGPSHWGDDLQDVGYLFCSTFLLYTSSSIWTRYVGNSSVAKSNAKRTQRRRRRLPMLLQLLPLPLLLPLHPMKMISTLT